MREVKLTDDEVNLLIPLLRRSNRITGYGGPHVPVEERKRRWELGCALYRRLVERVHEKASGEG